MLYLSRRHVLSRRCAIYNCTFFSRSRDTHYQNIIETINCAWLWYVSSMRSAGISPSNRAVIRKWSVWIITSYCTLKTFCLEIAIVKRTGFRPCCLCEFFTLVSNYADVQLSLQNAFHYFYYAIFLESCDIYYRNLLHGHILKLEFNH